MLKYYNFLMKILFKKKVFPIIFVFFVGLFCLIFIPSFDVEGRTTQKLFPINTFVSWFPFVFSTVFILTAAVRIFKTGESDGTELLISSKPILRRKIIIAKFLAILSMILIFNIFAFMFYIAVAEADSFATSNEKFMFALSMTLGGLIVSAIMGSIIIILSSILPKNAVVSVGILFSAAIPIISFVIVPMSNAISPYDVNPGNLQGTYLKSSGNFDYDPKRDSRTSFSNNIYILRTTDNIARDVKKVRDTWFKEAKFIDFWYQWGRFYSLAKPTNIKEEKNPNAQSFYRTKAIDYNEPSDLEVTRLLNEAKKTSIFNYYRGQEGIKTSSQYVMFFQRDEINFEKNKMLDAFNKRRYNELTGNSGALLNELKEGSDEIEKILRPTGNEIIQNSDYPKFLNQQFKNILKKIFNLSVDIDSKYYRILLWRAISDYQKNNWGRIQTLTSAIKASPDDIASKFASNQVRQYISQTQDLLYDNMIYKILFEENRFGGQWPLELINSQKNYEPYSISEIRKKYNFYTNFKESDYLETNSIIIAWSLIGVNILLISMVIYFRRDFR